MTATSSRGCSRVRSGQFAQPPASPCRGYLQVPPPHGVNQWIGSSAPNLSRKTSASSIHTTIAAHAYLLSSSPARARPAAHKRGLPALVPHRPPRGCDWRTRAGCESPPPQRGLAKHSPPGARPPAALRSGGWERARCQRSAAERSEVRAEAVLHSVGTLHQPLLLISLC